MVVAFQPHLYSRTREFAGAFGAALGLADEVVVMDVYGAREDPVPGVTGAMVADAVALPAERVHFEPSWSAAAPALADRARPGDLVITMGAGNVSMVGPEGTSWTAVLDGIELGRIGILLPGEHMARNSAAALLAGIELGLPVEGLVAGLARFGGVHRRFELKGAAGGVRVYDDYAHHPTEVEAQLRAARAVAGPGRVVVAFQPHLYSRTTCGCW